MKTQKQRFEEYAVGELQIDPVWMSEGFYDEQKDRYALNDIQRDYEKFNWSEAVGL